MVISARRPEPHVYACVQSSADRFNINSQLEHLQSKYIGTGHADTTKLCASPSRYSSDRAALAASGPLTSTATHLLLTWDTGT